MPDIAKVLKLSQKKTSFYRFLVVLTASAGFSVFSPLLFGSNASAQMHQDSEGRWVNSAGGNLYGDSNFNLDADPRFNLDADPRFNLDADPSFNMDANPRFNMDANPRFNMDGDSRYKNRD